MLLADHAVQPTMSRGAIRYDNAKAESFMKTLKQEQLQRDLKHCAPSHQVLRSHL
jgi:transposase InsO family protein